MLRGMLMEPGNIPVSTSSLGLRTSMTVLDGFFK